jgi:hypothetical protein
MQSHQASRWVTFLAQPVLLQHSHQQAEPQQFLVQLWPVVQLKRPSKQPKLALVADSTLARWSQQPQQAQQGRFCSAWHLRSYKL